MARRTNLGEAEYNFVSNAAKFIQEIKAIDSTLEQLAYEQTKLTQAFKSGTISLEEMETKFGKLTDAITRLKAVQSSMDLTESLNRGAQAAAKVQKTMDDITVASNRSRVELSAVAHILDDLQYVGQMGLQPIVNNLTQMSATVGLVAIGAFQLYKNWDSLVSLMNGSSAIETEAEEMERLAKATALTADEAKRLADYKRDTAGGERISGMATKEEADQQAAFDEAFKNMSREDRDRLVQKIIEDDPKIRESAEIEIDNQIAKEGPNWIKRQINDVGSGISAITGMAATTLMKKDERITIESLDQKLENERLEKERARQGMIDQRVLEMANQRIGNAATDPGTLAQLLRLDSRFSGATKQARDDAKAIEEDEKENERRTKLTEKRRQQEERDVAKMIAEDERENARRTRETERRRARGVRDDDRQEGRVETEREKEIKRVRSESLAQAMNLVPGMDDALSQMMANGRMNGMDPRAMRDQLRGTVMSNLTDRGMPVERAAAAAVQILDRSERLAEEKVADEALRQQDRIKPYRHQKIDMAAFGDQILTMGGGDPEQENRSKSYDAQIRSANYLKTISEQGVRARMAGGQR